MSTYTASVESLRDAWDFLPSKARVLALHHVSNFMRTEALVEPVSAARHVIGKERQDG